MSLRRLLLSAAVLLMSAALVACGPTGVAPAAGVTPAARSDCTTLHFPYPPATVDLGAADNGRTTTVPIGALVSVALLGQGSHWQPIQFTGAGLVRLSTQAETATVGTQLAEFCATAKGTAHLNSSNERTSWSALIEVQ